MLKTLCFTSLITMCSDHSQTIDTRIKLAYALARQWFGIYITPEAPNDGKWLSCVFIEIYCFVFINPFLIQNVHFL